MTGASRGLGLALTRALVADGWSWWSTRGRSDELAAATAGLPGPGRVVAIPGDVTDPEHRQRLAEAAADGLAVAVAVGRQQRLLPGPIPSTRSSQDYPLDTLRRVYEVNTFAPLALIQLLLPLMTEVGWRRHQHHLRCRRRGICGMGWLRLFQGRPRATVAGAGCRTTTTADLLGRSR